MTTINAVNTSLSGQTGTGNFVGAIAPTFTTSWAYAASGFAILDNNGKNQITFLTQASAVNYFNFQNSATTFPPTFSATGSDTNVGFNFQSKGVGSYTFNGGTVNILTLTPIASGVNNFAMTAATTGNGVSFQAVGSDPNVPMNLGTKGSGAFSFLSNVTVSPATLFTLTPSSTPVNWLAITSSNATVPLTITATGSDTNIPIQLVSKGTAGVQVKGASDASTAAAGYVGEVISSSIAVGSAVSLTSTIAKTITSISLTAGDWDVWAVLNTNPASTTTTSVATGSISTTNNTLSTQSINTPLATISGASGATQPQVFSIGPGQQNISATTTIYLVANVTFAVSTMSAYGYIMARRIR